MNTRIPKGIEVLVKKASVDPAFKALLLERRAGAAQEIGLELDVAETMMLAAVPAGQLEAIIARTDVPQEHRRAFLGHAAAAMLAAIGAMATAAPAWGGSFDKMGKGKAPPMAGSGGMRRDHVPSNQPTDNQPTEQPNPLPPLKRPKTIEERVTDIVAQRFNVPKEKVQRETSFVKDLHASVSQLVNLKRQFEKQFHLKIPNKDFEKIGTVSDAIDYVKKAVEGPLPPEPSPSRGMQPDRPAPGSMGIRPDRLMPAPGGSRPDAPP